MPTGTPFNPAGIAKPSVGQALFNLGFTTTRWIPQDGTVNDLKEGRFDPTSNSPIQRYGNPKGLGAKGWPPEQYTGGHSTGQNPHAIKLAPIVLGASADPQQDAADLNFVKGATQRVLQLARDQGLLGPVFVPPSEKPPAPTPVPVPTPTPTTTERAAELRRMAEQAPVAFLGVVITRALEIVPRGLVDAALVWAVEIYRKLKARP